jgi:hypothetical protein
MRESRTYGSVRGALSNERPYRDRAQCRRSYDGTGGRAAIPVMGMASHSVFLARACVGSMVLLVAPDQMNACREQAA